MKKIIFVCLGNICRSPLAQAMMEKIIRDENADDRYLVDSSGTGSWHVGSRSDARMIKTGEKYDLKMDHLAKQLAPEHGEAFDYLFMMDRQNYRDALKIVDKKYHQKIYLFRNFDTISDSLDVPDPYYGGSEGFENVYQIVKRNCQILFSLIEKEAIKKEKNPNI